MEQSPWESNCSLASQEIPRVVITALTWVRHLFMFWARSIQPMCRLFRLRSILLLAYHLRLGLTRGLLLWGFWTKTKYAPFLLPICVMCPILFHLITLVIFGEEWSSRKFVIMQPPVASLVLGQNVFLLQCSFSVWEPKFHTHIKQQAKS
jgi:hypothetical protein